MTDLISELFYLAKAAMEEPPRVCALNAALEECRVRIEGALGAEFAERAANMEFERYRLEALSYFREGFRTALALLRG